MEGGEDVEERGWKGRGRGDGTKGKGKWWRCSGMGKEGKGGKWRDVTRKGKNEQRGKRW